MLDCQVIAYWARMKRIFSGQYLCCVLTKIKWDCPENRRVGWHNTEGN